MSEKRFIISKNTSERSTTGIIDVEKQDLLWVSEVVDLLNEQQATIQQLKAKLKEKEEDEQLYANEIVKLNKEAKEVLDFKSLGGDY